ncbi:MAG: atp4 subunit B of the stator stalk of mitochondrial F1F0 ATP synthase [Trizodia sp. TS-e1964]|nr:MAG: atp4 subunit B of the stator stalk of mitochondrial F1F0 ATP synthase [Trizodia sp. TS-e1964]
MSSMASLLMRKALGPSLLRQSTQPRIASLITFYSTSSTTKTEDPKKKAQSIIDSLPGTSLISKTAILSAGASISIGAISNELYVVNEESVVAFCLLSVFWAIAKYGGPLYGEWAEGQIGKIKGILNNARDGHTAAVRSRIESVKELATVVEITKHLFEASKETASLEAKAFELEQRTAFVQDAKSVLDSWIRYEGQVKQRQQQELAEMTIGRIKKELENPKTLQQILQQSVLDVEKIIASKNQ